MKKYNWLNLVLLLTFGFGLYIFLSGDLFYTVEREVFGAVRVLAPAADIPFYLITELGSAVGVISVTVILVIVSAFLKHFSDIGLPIALTTIVSRIINITIKNLFDRPRPDFKILDVSESSFPSGHSQNNMALYIAVLIAILLVSNSDKIKTISKIVCVVIPVIIGITRIYFGVHYVSDVISGWSMGAFVAYNTMFLYYKYILTKFKTKEKPIDEVS